MSFEKSISLHVEKDETFHRVTGYGETEAGGYVAVDGTRFSHSLVLTPKEIGDWPPRTFDEVTAEHFALLLALDPEVVLFGSGKVQRFPDRSLFDACTERGVGVEVMGTAAACRIYNLIAGEGRMVAAALLMPC
uniref:Uncharacterized conserved protein, contains Mth938-like domain n=1 Tax=Candidatus Kentrum sp. MB TaxID=2138164 RepID=A0A450XPE9_9GAMM|nr:MAG: Uncharacterized conserved protein, contains Mth938-like domain [Candidatus Kentron sp. MB]VFK34631.1 MAG: Uncharacterized conserved protein, contains Mth938-like domain [Candidatus Kentron sp. MB]VFK76834.1 MAG: Uncharacterized conserved protein, contains Mth938-like domain [Candidatus Kentron sp. MB]